MIVIGAGQMKFENSADKHYFHYSARAQVEIFMNQCISRVPQSTVGKHITRSYRVQLQSSNLDSINRSRKDKILDQSRLKNIN